MQTRRRRVATNRLAPVTDSKDDPGLHLRVESELHPTIQPGRGSLLMVHGWCFHAREHVRNLRIELGGKSHPLIAQGMPRADVVNNLPPSIGDSNSAFRSGFWGLVPITPVPEPSTVEMRMEAKLSGGAVVSREIGEIRLEPWEHIRQPPPTDLPKVAICMATFNPPIELFRRQIESIRAQTYGNWTCLISDDDSRPEVF